jgi:phosphate/sulfate permease
MSSALIMMNVTIFALPLSSTHIMFSGLAGVTLIAFRDYSNLNELVKTPWLVIEGLIWILSPLVAMGITYAMYIALHKSIYDKKDSRKRVIKFIPYQVSITLTLMGSVLVIKSFIDSELT